MQLIDSHSHIYLPEFDADRGTVIQNAVEAGITQLIIPNVDLETLPLLDHLCNTYPQHCFPAIGLHPTSVTDNYTADLIKIRNRIETGRCVAIGETGIDLYWDKTHAIQQADAFRQQLNWALEFDLPVIIHSREAFDAIISVLDEFTDRPLKGVFHCFSGTNAQAHEMVSRGFFLGIGGVVTFKNGGLNAALADISPQQLLVETDAPYLAPVPHRGKRNEPAYLLYTVTKLADFYGLTPAEIAAFTTINAKKLFGL